MPVQILTLNRDGITAGDYLTGAIKISAVERLPTRELTAERPSARVVGERLPVGTVSLLAASSPGRWLRASEGSEAVAWSGPSEDSEAVPPFRGAR
jgi:hypothetical protein